MSLEMRWAVVVAAGVSLAALLHGGIYQIVPQSVSGGGEGGERGVAYRLNRLTGNVTVCDLVSSVIEKHPGHVGVCGPMAWLPDVLK